MRISIFGLGYVGCVCAARLANADHVVVGVDTNDEKAAMVNDGVSPIVEPGLNELLSKAVGTGRLRAISSCEQAVEMTDLALVCVGTPGFANGSLNVDILARVCHEIGHAVSMLGKPYNVVIRSTVLPGTTETVVIPALLAERADGVRPRVKVAVNPEFMREGTALQDFMQPPMTLIGSEDEELAALLRILYGNVDAPFVHAGIRTAEMIKYACNSYHALKVCFANEIGDACEAFGADAQEVMRIFRMDRKLNLSGAYLRPGFAFGGSCLPKDIRALVSAARNADVELPLISTILPSNKAQVDRAVGTILATRKRQVGVVGLSFKPGTDDLRESPMVTLVEALIGKGLDIRILDHNISIARLVGANRRYIEEEIPHIASLMCESVDELLAHSDVLVIGNTCEESEQLVARVDPGKTVIDLTRNLAQSEYAKSMEVAGAWKIPQAEPSTHLSSPVPPSARS